MKRQRGRSRRSGGGGNNINRHFESNGPDVKIRGSAQQVLEKYLQYARDAQTSGDRIMSEAYFQHAEHYQRLLASMQPREKPRREREEGEAGGETEEAAPAETEGEAAAATAESSEAGDMPDAEKDEARPRRGRRERKPRTNGADDPLKVVDAESADAPAEADAQAEAEEKPRTRRAYKRRTSEPEEAANPDDGVMKTLSRGRSSEADDGEPGPEETEDAPVK